MTTDTAHRPLKVCILTTVHKSDDARIFHRQALSLCRAGYAVTLLAPDRTVKLLPLKTTDNGICPAPAQHDTNARPLGRGHSRLLRMTLGLITALHAALRQRAAVYHFHDPELLPVGLVLKTLGKRVIYDVHEDYPEQMLSKHYLPGPIRRIVSAAVAAIEKAVSLRLDAIVCATPAIASRFPLSRTVVVRNYPVLPPRKSRARGGNCVGPESRTRSIGRPRPTPHPESRSSPAPFRLIHPGATLTPERGTTNLIRAMALLDDRFELVLAGRFVTPQYEAALRNEPGFRRVRYLGTIAHREVWDWYRRSDAGIICLLPLRRFRQSLPVKLFEFMATSLPVIASDFPELRPVVAGGRCGFCVDPERPGEIAAAVRWLARDPALCLEMGENARAAAESRYNWRPEEKRLLALYHEILTPHSAARPLGRSATLLHPHA